MPSVRSSISNSGVSSTGSPTSSQRSNQPALSRLYSFGSQKLNQISGHFTPQIGQNPSDESQCFIPSPMSSPSIPSSFETLESHSENFKNSKLKSNHLPLPKLLSKSTSRMKKALQDFQDKNQNSEKSTYPSFHQNLSETYPTVPQSNEVDSNSNINQEDQTYEAPKTLHKRGLIKFDQKEFIEQKLKAKEILELEADLRLFELSVSQITRQRAKSEHKQSVKKNETKNQTNKLRLSYEAHTNPSLKLNLFQHLQNHSQPSNSFEPPRNEIFEPLALGITNENPQVFVSHHQDKEITNNNAQEAGDKNDEDGDEDEVSLYEVTPEHYDVKEELILPTWPNHL